MWILKIIKNCQGRENEMQNAKKYLRHQPTDSHSDRRFVSVVNHFIRINVTMTQCHYKLTINGSHLFIPPISNDNLFGHSHTVTAQVQCSGNSPFVVLSSELVLCLQSYGRMRS